MLPNDPQNSTDPVDLLGQPIAAGDFVAWPVKSGSSAAMSVGRIESIHFKHRNPNWPSSRTEFVDGPQEGAEHYTVKVRPFKSTGFYYSHRTWVPSQGYIQLDEGIKPVTLRKVGNIVKLNVDAVENAYAKDPA